MTTAKNWTVDIRIDEDVETRHTRAEALLRRGEPTEVRGVGTSWRNPADPEVPEIGDELAVARALADLSGRLRNDAAGDLAEVNTRASHGW